MVTCVAVGKLGADGKLGRLGAVKGVLHQFQDALSGGAFLSHKSVGDRTRFYKPVKESLGPDPLNKAHITVCGEVYGVGVIDGVIDDAALHDVTRILPEIYHVRLGKPSRRAFRGRFLQGEFQAVLFRVLPEPHIHGSNDPDRLIHRFSGLVHLLPGDEFHRVIHSDKPDDVGARFEVNVLLPVGGLLSDLPQRPALLHHPVVHEVLLAEVRLHRHVHGLIYLFDNSVNIASPLFGGEVCRMWDVDGDILEPAEAHAFRVQEHVVVVNRRAETAACR